MEPHLWHVNIVKHRGAFTRLQVSCYRLEVEVGRYHKSTVTPVLQRVCQICHVLEDGIHSLCLPKILCVTGRTLHSTVCSHFQCKGEAKCTNSESKVN